MEEYVLICEDSMEGILSGIYEAYQYKKEMGIEHHESIHLAVKEPVTQRFFTQYKPIQTDHEKAAKVTDTIVRQLGNDTWYRISMAMVSDFEDKADAVYHTVVLGLRLRDRQITDRLQEDCVLALIHIRRCRRRG